LEMPMTRIGSFSIESAVQGPHIHGIEVRREHVEAANSCPVLPPDDARRAGARSSAPLVAVATAYDCARLVAAWHAVAQTQPFLKQDCRGTIVVAGRHTIAA